MSQLSKEQLKVENNTEFPNNNVGAITPSHLRAFNVDMIDSTVNQTSFDSFSGSVASEINALEAFSTSLDTNFASQTEFNAYTQSANSRLNSLESATSSYATAAITASSLITASFASQTLTFTKGDGSTFGIVIPDVSGSTIDTGSFATTASFNAYTQSNDDKVNALINATSSYAISSSVAAVDGAQQAQINSLINATSSYATSAITASSLITASVSLNTITFTKGDNTTFALTVDTGSGGGGGGVTFARPSIETISGSVLITANTFTSGASSITHISGSSQNLANILFKTSNTAGSTIVSGSFNLFTNPAAPSAGRLNYLENSNIFLNDSGFLPTVTASVLNAGGFYPRLRNNMWLGTGPWTINTNAFASSSTQAASLNNNLFLGSTGTTINSLGNTSGPTFSHNLLSQAGVTINAPSRSLAEIAAGASGSNVVSFINNSAFGGNITYNGPVSSSTHTIAANSIQGNLTLNLQSGSRLHTISNNILNGALTVNDNTVFTPTLGANSIISQNNINGSIIITNRASASINLQANNLGGFTITNEYDSSTNGSVGRNFVLQGNVMLGFIANNIYFSGSAAGANSTNERGRGFYGNLIGGSRISASVIGDGNRHFLASAVWGQGLSVYGTGLYDLSNAAIAGGQNGGSAFFGRWNAEDGNRALSSQTVLAIGTGNSGSAGIVRKTGFLIDSGSNTFIEGTLNVSGSSTLSGSFYIQSASANLPAQTGSAVLTYNPTTGQVGQASYTQLLSASFDVGGFQTNNTKSGSAGVSQSIDFEITDVSKGITMVSNTQATIQNAGTYLLIFSAQLNTNAGADTVWMWLKKNGTNVAESATKAVMANNTAQVMTVNFMLELAANDYIELVWENLNGHAQILAEGASGNYPAIPAVILTINQIH